MAISMEAESTSSLPPYGDGLYHSLDGAEKENPHHGGDGDALVEGDTVCCCCCESWCTRWRFAVRIAVFSLLVAIPAIWGQTMMPEVKKAYFGSDQKAALVSAAFDGSIAIVNLFLVVAYSRLLDSVGRRPLLIALGLAQIVQFTLLALFPTQPIPYMVARMFGSLIQQSALFAMVADVVAEGDRQFAYTIVGSAGMVGMLFALPVGMIHAKDQYIFIAAAVASVFAPVYAYFCIPETLPAEKRTPFEWKGALENPVRGVTDLCQNRALAILTTAVCIMLTADLGAQEVYLYYLNQRLGFNDEDNGIFFAIMAVSSLFGYYVLMPMVQKRLTSHLVLTMALFANALMMLFVGAAWARYVVFGVALLYGPIMLALPTSQAMVANTGPAAELTQRLTALTSVIDLCHALGPLAFGALYGALPDSLIQIPFFVSAAMCAGAAIAVWRLLPRALEMSAAEPLEDA